MKTLKEALINLLKVKSLFSLVAMAMFVFLIVTEKITGEVAMATITAIVTYYFAKRMNPNRPNPRRLCRILTNLQLMRSRQREVICK